MFNSFRAKLIAVISLTLVILLGLIGMGLLIAQSLLKLEQDWQSYNQQSSKAFFEFDQLQRRLGYGGMIHNFYSYLIKPEAVMATNLHYDFTQLRGHLLALQSLNLDPAERVALAQVKEKIEAYRLAFHQAQRLHALGNPPLTLQQKLTLPAGDAASALQELNESLFQRAKNKQKEASRHLRQALLWILSGVVLVPLILLMGVYLVLLLRDLVRAKDQAQQAEAVKGEFLANVSHEIRTPLNAVLGMAELLFKTPLNPQQSRYVSLVKKSAATLLRLLNEILDQSKLEEGKMHLETVTFNLVELLTELAEHQRPLAAAKGITLKLFVDASVAPLRRGDPNRLTQVVTNLVSNAIKFTNQGGVGICLAPDPQGLLITVEDTGQGIPPERQEQIFDRFTQADASIARHHGGTGLGTSIARELVLLMQGRIWLESTLGRGTRFFVALPLPVAEEATTDEAPHPEGKPQQSGELPLKTRVLLAEDQEVSRVLAQINLQQRGLEVSLAKDGAEVLAQWQAGKFDAILLDVHMPLVDGYEAARRIRAQEAALGLTPIPLIALTASLHPADYQRCLQVGMNDALAKPVDFDLLMQKLRALLQGHAAGTATPEPTPDPETLPDLDYAKGLRHWGQVQRAYDQALKEFPQRQGPKLPEVRRLLALGQADQAWELVHGISGVAASLGALDLHQAAWALETVLRGEGANPAAAERFAAAFERLLAKLESLPQ